MFNTLYHLIATAVQGDAGAAKVALTMARIGVGAFFGITGWHKLMDTDRHESMRAVLAAYGLDIGPNHAMVWFVSAAEFLGGVAVAIGFLTPFAVIPLSSICVVAVLTDGKQRVADEVGTGIDWTDRLSTWLYLPEVIWCLVLAAVAVAGSGPLSVDYLLFS